MSDAELPRLIPRASASGAKPGWRCPDEETLAAWVEGSLAGKRAGRSSKGTSPTAPSAAARSASSRAPRSSARFPPFRPTCSPPRGASAPLFGLLRPATLVAAGAGLVLALLVVVAVGTPGSRSSAGPEAERGRPGRANRPRPRGRAPWIVRPSEGEIVPRAALELRWEEAPEALFYTVQLVDPKGDVVWEGRADGARLAVPANAALAPGQPYFAWVLAHLRSGTTVRSPAVGFRLAPG